MTKGWFIGNFEPNIIKTEQFEVGVKRYREGDYEAEHHHRISTEITVILAGVAEMNGVRHESGSIIQMSPFESTDFRALTDLWTVVVKVPSSTNDKYLGKYKA
jgi:hypothetical protein